MMETWTELWECAQKSERSLRFKRMGNWNEYGKRMDIMHSLSSPFKRKRRRLSAQSCLHFDSSLLGPFESRKKALALPVRQSTDPFQSDFSRGSPVSLLGTISSRLILSPLPRPLQGPQRHFHLARGMSSLGSGAAGLTEDGQKDELWMKEVNVQQQSEITEIALQGSQRSETNVFVGQTDGSGRLLETQLFDQWMRAKAHLRENDLRDLEDYRRRVDAIDQQSLASNHPRASATSGEEANHNLNLQEPTYSAGPGTLPLAVAPGNPSIHGSGFTSLGSSTQEGNQRARLPVWKEIHERSHSRDPYIKDIEAEIALTSSRLTSLRLTRKEGFAKSKLQIPPDNLKEERITSDAFTPLSKEEDKEVDNALNGHTRQDILAMHEKSNIDITRAAMQCLLPGVWLNDEVINLYLELLKERELREPKKFLKCHFFNTFFFNKLYKDKHAYDFKAVRRWTTQKKLGYNLLECDKIFVPIHKDIHWCLAIINIREKKMEYLDSLKGRDGNALQVLAKYIKDEARDKLNKDLDVSTWDRDCPQDIPQQLNGCDCGMFMIKYADFHSRGALLKFTQEHMEYFRRRTVLELLQLKAR